jgi:CMP-2-keto-3-deoxyoctulosonic acid synthetase
MATIVIPARYGSTRFPGKPMHPICGIAMLERVCRIARPVRNCGRIVVATERNPVAEFAKPFGVEVVVTSDRPRNGTERVFEAVGVANVTDDIVINLLRINERIELVLRHVNPQKAVHRGDTRRDIARKNIVRLVERDPRALDDLEAASGVRVPETGSERTADLSAVPFNIAAMALIAFILPRFSRTAEDARSFP